MDKKTPTLDELIRLRVVLSIPGMDAVRRLRDVVYNDTDSGPLHMDICSPERAVGLLPAVLFVHGGPVPRLGAKNMGIYVSYGELMAASGLVGVTFNHRFLSSQRLTDAATDLTDAMTYVRDNANKFGIDPDRLALWLFSGGGPLLTQALREHPKWLRAVVAYYALLDLQQPPPGADDGLTPELRTRFSALDALGDDARALPPMFIARAGLDNSWLNGTIDRFVRAAVEKGATLDLLTHPDGRHAFDILDDDERSKAIIRRTIEFLRDALGERR